MKVHLTIMHVSWKVHELLWIVHESFITVSPGQAFVTVGYTWNVCPPGDTCMLPGDTCKPPGDTCCRKKWDWDIVVYITFTSYHVALVFKRIKHTSPKHFVQKCNTHQNKVCRWCGKIAHIVTDLEDIPWRFQAQMWPWPWGQQSKTNTSNSGSLPWSLVALYHVWLQKVLQVQEIFKKVKC